MATTRTDASPDSPNLNASPVNPNSDASPVNPKADASPGGGNDRAPAAPAVVSVVGPTAVGKTEIALSLADDFGGRIVSLDSRQLYRRMDIGTAKPGQQQLARAHHYLVDVVDPDQPVSLADVQALAHAAIAETLEAGDLPILVGGTGQYVKAVWEGWQIPTVAPDQAIRRRLRRRAADHGPQALHAELAEIDPAAARAIHPNNVRRVVRALEVFEVTGRPISELQGREPPPWDFINVGLTRAREALYVRVDARIEQMVGAGLEDEVRRLVEAGFGFELPAMSSLGYAEWQPVLVGDATAEEAVAAIRRNTRRFVRAQYAWFSLSDPEIEWFDLGDTSYGAIRLYVAGRLAASA